MEEEEEELSSCYEEVSGKENILSLFASLENKIIFLKHGIEKKPHLEMVEELGENISGM